MSACLSTRVVIISLQREAIIEEDGGATLSLITRETHYLADKLCDGNSGTVSDGTWARCSLSPSLPAPQHLFCKPSLSASLPPAVLRESERTPRESKHTHFLSSGCKWRRKNLVSSCVGRSEAHAPSGQDRGTQSSFPW